MLLEEPSWCQRFLNPIPRGLSARSLSLIAASNPASAAPPRPPRGSCSSEVLQGTCRLGTECLLQGSCSAGNPGAESTSPEEQAGLGARCLRSWKRHSTPCAQGPAPLGAGRGPRSKAPVISAGTPCPCVSAGLQAPRHHAPGAAAAPGAVPCPWPMRWGSGAGACAAPASPRVLSNPAHASASLQTKPRGGAGKAFPSPEARQQRAFFFPRWLQSPLYSPVAEPRCWTRLYRRRRVRCHHLAVPADGCGVTTSPPAERAGFSRGCAGAGGLWPPPCRASLPTSQLLVQGAERGGTRGFFNTPPTLLPWGFPCPQEGALHPGGGSHLAPFAGAP